MTPDYRSSLLNRCQSAEGGNGEALIKKMMSSQPSAFSDATASPSSAIRPEQCGGCPCVHLTPSVYLQDVLSYQIFPCLCPPVKFICATFVNWLGSSRWQLCLSLNSHHTAVCFACSCYGCSVSWSFVLYTWWGSHRVMAFHLMFWCQVALLALVLHSDTAIIIACCCCGSCRMYLKHYLVN